VEFEQGGEKRAEYGEALLKQLAADLSARYGRGFSERNLEQMRRFYMSWPISQTLSAKFDFLDRASVDRRACWVVLWYLHSYQPVRSLARVLASSQI
jgi:hypothetical protein